MINSSVVFLDSGVGGLPYCDFFAKRNPHYPTFYIADREHFPYGEKTKEELCALLFKLTEKIIKKIAPGIIVLACNTASVSALKELRGQFPEKNFVGTVPAIKPALLERKKVGVLGTVRTVHEPYIENLAQTSLCNSSEFAHEIDITKMAAPDLVQFVEHRFLKASEDEKMFIVQKYIDKFRAQDVDGIVLGCTHFLFLLPEFKKAGEPDIKIYDSIEGVCHRVEGLLSENLTTNHTATGWRNYTNGTENIKLLVTGRGVLEESWGEFGEMFGMGVEKFE